MERAKLLAILNALHAIKHGCLPIPEKDISRDARHAMTTMNPHIFGKISLKTMIGPKNSWKTRALPICLNCVRPAKRESVISKPTQLPKKRVDL